MSDRFTFGTALYHPSIDIEDPRWLRSAVLFWDHIQTIVPTAIENPYQNADTHILFEEGILSPLAPDRHPDVLERLEPQVMGFIDKPDDREFFGILPDPDNPAAMELVHSGKFGFLLGDEMEASRLFAGKLSPHMRERFGNWKPDEEGFLKVSAHFADFYLSILAAGLAEEVGSSPLSDKGQAFGANLRTIVGQVKAGEADHANGALVSIAMEKLVIDPAVPMDRLLKFKRQNIDQLEALAAEFDRLSGQIEASESVKDLQSRAGRIYRRDVRPKLEALKQTLDDQSIGCGFGGMTLAATVSVSPGALLGSVIGLTGSILLGVGGFLAVSNLALQSHLARRRTRRESPFTYLADLQRNFTIPQNLIED